MEFTGKWAWTVGSNFAISWDDLRYAFVSDMLLSIYCHFLVPFLCVEIWKLRHIKDYEENNLAYVQQVASVTKEKNPGPLHLLLPVGATKIP